MLQLVKFEKCVLLEFKNLSFSGLCLPRRTFLVEISAQCYSIYVGNLFLLAIIWQIKIFKFKE